MIAQLKNVVTTIKRGSSFSRSSPSLDIEEPSTPRHRTPSGSVAVYVGPERRRFVIPTRFINFPVFVALLDQAEEELGFQAAGGLALPCEIEFFQRVLRCLEESEAKFRSMGLSEFAKMVSEMDFESEDNTPLLNNSRV